MLLKIKDMDLDDLVMKEIWLIGNILDQKCISDVTKGWYSFHQTGWIRKKMREEAFYSVILWNVKFICLETISWYMYMVYYLPIHPTKKRCLI